MKKYLFLAALLCGTSVVSMGAERNSSEEKLANKTSKVEMTFSKIKEKAQFFFDFECHRITFSCGETGLVCGNSMQEVGAIAEDFDEIVCP